MTDMDERYATFRELAGLSERTATVEADMRQIMPALARIETMVASRTQPQPPQETAAALALHRAVDAIDKAGKSGAPTWLVVLAMIGMLALGLLGAKLLGLA